MKRIKKVEESSALIGKVFDSFETDSHQDAPSIYVVRNTFSNPNLLVNGDFQIWQRGNAFSFNANNRFNYCADRWAIYKSIIENDTSILEVNKVDKGLSARNNGVSKDKNIKLSQILEVKLDTDKVYTLSAKINGKIESITFNGGNYVDGLTIGYSAYSTSERVYALLQNDWIVEWVKLEYGSIMTPFVPRLYEEEYQLCRRYYKCFMLKGSKYTISSNMTYYSCYMNLGMMRKIPSVIKKTVAFVNIGNADISKLIVGSITYNLNISQTMGFTVLIYNEVVQHQNDITAIIELDAEIY